MRDGPVAIEMKYSEWENLSDSLADVLCWCHGFLAAQPEDKNVNLWGLKELRELNITIKDSLAKQRNQCQTE